MNPSAAPVTRIPVERRFPLGLRESIASIRELYESGKQQRWDPVRDIDWNALSPDGLAQADRDAARSVWSRRAWVEIAERIDVLAGEIAVRGRERLLIVAIPTAILYALAACICRRDPGRRLPGLVLAFFAAALFPFAAWLSVQLLWGAHPGDAGATVAAAVTLAAHLATLAVFRSPLLTIPWPASLLWLVGVSGETVLGKSDDALTGAFLGAGLAMVAVGVWLHEQRRNAYAHMPDFVGAVTALGAVMMLGANGHRLGWELLTIVLSLGAIDFGMIVDSSVVMIENCVRHIAHNDARERPLVDVVRDAAVGHGELCRCCWNGAWLDRHQVRGEHSDVGAFADFDRAALILREAREGWRSGEHAKSLGAADGFFEAPVWPREAAKIMAIRGGVELDQWIPLLDRRIGAAGDHRAGIEQRAPGVGAGETIETEAHRCEEEVADRV